MYGIPTQRDVYDVDAAALSDRIISTDRMAADLAAMDQRLARIADGRRIAQRLLELTQSTGTLGATLDVEL